MSQIRKASSSQLSRLASLPIGILAALSLAGCPETLDIDINNPQANLTLPDAAAVGESRAAANNDATQGGTSNAAPEMNDNAHAPADNAATADAAPPAADPHNATPTNDMNTEPAPMEPAPDATAPVAPEPNTPTAPPAQATAPVGGCNNGRYVGDLDGIQAQANLQFEFVQPDAITQALYIGGEVNSGVAYYTFTAEIRNGSRGWGDMVDHSDGSRFQIQIDLYTDGFLLTANPFGPGPTQYVFTCH